VHCNYSENQSDSKESLIDQNKKKMMQKSMRKSFVFNNSMSRFQSHLMPRSRIVSELRYRKISRAI
jgi:hypothetical protein